jgi:hypothetical protein
VNFENRYGWLERVLHRVAFATPLAQVGVADMEERLFRKRLVAIELDTPVLITALPRAGTTILLQLIAASSTFASHTYRDMPLVLCPMLWDRLSRRFRRADTPRERAHGDGIEVSLDSPEAFEEMVWKFFWSRRYRGQVIEPWETCEHEDFARFFMSHMRKVVAVRAEQKPTARRYVSKNNLNIARIPAIWEAVPSAMIVVPFREPLQHAASLLRQHRRFKELHARDAFARRYMAAIGHYDFGENLRPVDFGQWYEQKADRDPDRLEFWIDYWIAVHRHVLAHASHERLVLVSFEVLCETRDVAPLARALDIDDPDLLQAAHDTLKPARPHSVEDQDIPSGALEEAMGLHEQLQDACVH